MPSIGVPSLFVSLKTTVGFLPGTTKVVGGPYDAMSDSSVAYDAAHRVWLISSLALVGQLPVGAAIVVSRSPDGVHWTNVMTQTLALPGRPRRGLGLLVQGRGLDEADERSGHRRLRGLTGALLAG